MKSDLPTVAQRAVTFAMPYRRVYAARLAPKSWLVIHPDTGDAEEMPDRDFRAVYMPERESPPAALRLFDGMPAYASWRFGKLRPGR